MTRGYSANPAVLLEAADQIDVQCNIDFKGGEWSR